MQAERISRWIGGTRGYNHSGRHKALLGERTVSTLWQRLIQTWRDDGLELPAGVNPSAIREFELKYGVVLPDDMREFFLAVDGTGGVTDGELVTFWSLAEVKPVSEVLSETNPQRLKFPGRFFFADYCILCWGFVVHLEQHPAKLSGPVFEIDHEGASPTPIAESFTDFVEGLLADRDDRG